MNSASLRSRLPAPLKRLFYRLFTLSVRLRCVLDDARLRLSRRRDSPPIPPALLRFRVGESLDVADFLEVGRLTAEKLHQGLDDAGAAPTPRRLLDFGCGCGRTLRWMAPMFPATTAVGVDIDKASVQWCARHFPKAHFQITGSRPPLPFAAASFDVIYAVSVFTHLGSDLQAVWLKELARLLTSHGCALITLHGRTALEAFRPDDLTTLDSVGLHTLPAPRLAAFFPNWYATSFHSREYVLERFGRDFAAVHHRSGFMGHQDLVVCRQPRTLSVAEQLPGASIA